MFVGFGVFAAQIASSFDGNWYFAHVNDSESNPFFILFFIFILLFDQTIDIEKTTVFVTLYVQVLVAAKSPFFDNEACAIETKCSN